MLDIDPFKRPSVKEVLTYIRKGGESDRVISFGNINGTKEKMTEKSTEQDINANAVDVVDKNYHLMQDLLLSEEESKTASKIS